jgi:hypothetical protein
MAFLSFSPVNCKNYERGEYITKSSLIANIALTKIAFDTMNLIDPQMTNCNGLSEVNS